MFCASWANTWVSALLPLPTGQRRTITSQAQSFFQKPRSSSFLCFPMSSYDSLSEWSVGTKEDPWRQVFANVQSGSESCSRFFEQHPNALFVHWHRLFNSIRKLVSLSPFLTRRWL